MASAAGQGTAPWQPGAGAAASGQPPPTRRGNRRPRRPEAPAASLAWRAAPAHCATAASETLAQPLGFCRRPSQPLDLPVPPQPVVVSDPDRPRFHVHPPQGWMNDPNGAQLLRTARVQPPLHTRMRMH